jgi:hypothetical protein
MDCGLSLWMGVLQFRPLHGLLFSEASEAVALPLIQDLDRMGMGDENGFLSRRGGWLPGRTSGCSAFRLGC